MNYRHGGYKIGAVDNTNRTIQATVHQVTVKNSLSLSTSQEMNLIAREGFVVTGDCSGARRVTKGGGGALPSLRFTFGPGNFLPPSFSAGGRDVAGIPDPDRELVAALAEG